MLLLLCVCLLGVAFFLYWKSSPRTRGALLQQAYVWQRAGSGEMLDAVARSQAKFSNLILLGADVSFEGSQPRVARVDIDFRQLSSRVRAIGLVIHIDAFAGDFHDDITTRALVQVSKSLLTDAAAEGLEVRELQLDFPCDGAHLEDYRHWVTTIREAVAPVSVSFIALPGWLDQTAFPALARASDGYVLKLHGSVAGNATSMLLDPSTVLLSTESAAKFGVPFRVALPTYGMLLAFDPAGNYVGSSEEGPSPRWPASVQLRAIHTDPPTLARIVRNLEADRPLMLYGIIWHRLPVSTDQLNWQMQTLDAVMQGLEPLPDLHAVITRPEANLVEVWLLNHGDADAHLTQTLIVDPSSTTVTASDALTGFEIARQPEGVIQLRPTASISTLVPGARRLAGWLRVEGDARVTVKLMN